MAISDDYQNLKVGEEIIYHMGYLIKDRAFNKRLDNLAKEIFSRSTALIVSNKKINNACVLKSGTGELSLYQTKLNDVTFLYRAKRIKEQLKESTCW